MLPCRASPHISWHDSHRHVSRPIFFRDPRHASRYASSHFSCRILNHVCPWRVFRHISCHDFLCRNRASSRAPSFAKSSHDVSFAASHLTSSRLLRILAPLASRPSALTRERLPKCCPSAESARKAPKCCACQEIQTKQISSAAPVAQSKLATNSKSSKVLRLSRYPTLTRSRHATVAPAWFRTLLTDSSSLARADCRRRLRAPAKLDVSSGNTETQIERHWPTRTVAKYTVHAQAQRIQCFKNKLKRRVPPDSKRMATSSTRRTLAGVGERIDTSRKHVLTPRPL